MGMLVALTCYWKLLDDFAQFIWNKEKGEIDTDSVNLAFWIVLWPRVVLVGVFLGSVIFCAVVNVGALAFLKSTQNFLCGWPAFCKFWCWVLLPWARQWATSSCHPWQWLVRCRFGASWLLGQLEWSPLIGLLWKDHTAVNESKWISILRRGLKVGTLLGVQLKAL